YRRHYQPGNAVIAVVGDMDSNEATTLAERTLGPLPAGASGARVRPTPRRAGERRLTVEADIPAPMVAIAYPTPARFAEGDAELSLLPSLLGAPSGRLHQRLARDRRLAEFVVVYAEAHRLDGWLIAAMRPRDPRQIDALVAAFDEEMASLRQG